MGKKVYSVPLLKFLRKPGILHGVVDTYLALVHTCRNTAPSVGTRPLAVIAADLTVSSLRAFVREAVPGCEEDTTTSCFIINDLGNLVYDRDVFSNDGFDGTPWFIGEPLGSVEYFEVCGQNLIHTGADDEL